MLRIKILLIVWLLFLDFSAHSQVVFSFDYLTIYETYSDSLDAKPLTTYSFGDSKNDNMIFKVTKFKNDKIIAEIGNMADSIFYSYELKQLPIVSSDVIQIELLNPTIRNRYIPNSKSKIKDIYNVVYNRINDENEIIIEIFKNNKKRKKTYESHYIMESYPFVKNQFYVSEIRFAYAFDLNLIKTDEVIRESWFLNMLTNKKSNITKLKSIKQCEVSVFLK